MEMNNIQDGTWHGWGDTKYIINFGEKIKTYLQLLPSPFFSIKSL